jgi:hypothetical protein
MKKVRSVLPSLVAAAALTLGTATAASAASGNEQYPCADLGNPWPVLAYTCNGTWKAGTPGYRTFQSYINATRDHDTGWQTTTVQWIKSLDGRTKLVKWYCRYQDGTSSGALAATVVGGSHADTYSWRYGYHPCDGHGQGLVLNVYADYGGATYVTTVDVNSVVSGDGDHEAHPWRTA